MFQTEVKVIFFIVLLSLVVCGCTQSDSLFEPSGKAVFVPDDGVEFTKYASSARHNIEQALNMLRPQSENRQYLGGYTNEEVAAMRSPFQIPNADAGRCGDLSTGAGKGFLLIHGLTDSPYLMRSISESLNNEYPCALIRAVLLPGHGTVPGDSLDTEHEDWERIVDYGVNSFKKDNLVSELYIVGFSTGSSLAINYMKENPGNSITKREDKIKGLVLIATAVRAKTRIIFLTPVVKWMKDWASDFEEKDAARYESFSMNAAAEFYTLTKDMVNPEYALQVPVFMVLSADDATIDAPAAREFFCYPSRANRRALVWYQSIDPEVNNSINTESTPELMCENIVEVDLKTLDPKYKTVNLAHTALSISPEDPHYGFDGKYHNCKAYDSEDTVQAFNECQGDDKTIIFGEKNIKNLKNTLKYDYFRRGTFNPDYKNLEERILCFTNDECPTGDILRQR